MYQMADWVTEREGGGRSSSFLVIPSFWCSTTPSTLKSIG
jgi:hypothetical protein